MSEPNTPVTERAKRLDLMRQASTLAMGEVAAIAGGRRGYGRSKARVWRGLLRLALAVARREPDFVIGGLERPYLARWHVLPRNRFANLYLHLFLRPDDDRALHDHPWASCSIVLAGGYFELVPETVGGATAVHWRGKGAVVTRRASAPHRVDLNRCGEFYAPALTFFATGPVVRGWGFHCEHGWVPWQDFNAGPGCGANAKPGGWRNRTPTYRRR